MHAHAHARTPHFPACPAPFGDMCVPFPYLPCPPHPAHIHTFPGQAGAQDRRLRPGSPGRDSAWGQGRAASPPPLDQLPLLTNRSVGPVTCPAGADSGSGGLSRGSGLMTRTIHCTDPREGRGSSALWAAEETPRGQQGCTVCLRRPAAGALEQGKRGPGGPGCVFPAQLWELLSGK